MKNFRIRRFYGPCFPAFGLCGELLGISPYSVQMRETADQKNYEHGNFLHRENSFTVLFNVYMTMLLILLNLAALYGHHYGKKGSETSKQYSFLFSNMFKNILYSEIFLLAWWHQKLCHFSTSNFNGKSWRRRRRRMTEIAYLKNKKMANNYFFVINSVYSTFTLRIASSKWNPNLQILWQKSSYLPPTLS